MQGHKLPTHDDALRKDANAPTVTTVTRKAYPVNGANIGMIQSATPPASAGTAWPDESGCGSSFYIHANHPQTVLSLRR
jgi:hypothetical protein